VERAKAGEEYVLDSKGDPWSTPRLYMRMKAAIKKDSYRWKYKGRPYKYLNIGRYKYWLDNGWDDVGVLNREKQQKNLPPLTQKKLTWPAKRR
jgi:hypothetical protein